MPSAMSPFSMAARVRSRRPEERDGVEVFALIVGTVCE